MKTSQQHEQSGDAAQSAAHHSGAKGVALPAPVQMAGGGVMQMFDKEVAAIHPLTNEPAIFSLFDETKGIYMDKESKIKYDPARNEFTSRNGTVVTGTAVYKEDEPPTVTKPGLTSGYRDLTYTVDAKNRPLRARGLVYQSHTRPESGRSAKVQAESWEHTASIYRSMFMPPKDFNGGHLVAHHFGGSPGTNNMMPMEEKYNQNDAYKTFEQSIDRQLETLSPLYIEIDVTYLSDFDSLINVLVKNKTSDTIKKIKARDELKDIVMRTLGRIPHKITLRALKDPNSTTSYLVASPENPINKLIGTVRNPYNVDNLASHSFKRAKKSHDGDVRPKFIKPYEKSYGPNRGDEVADDKDYQTDYMNTYADMPRPGITSYKPGSDGLAGGVEAYIWMDPMGVFNRFGGSDTSDAVDPKGTQWSYFRAAYNANSGKGLIYKKGHLLNAELHGPGADSRNLLPLTAWANHDMSQNFENEVKKSEALVNPKKGVFWETAASGKVKRPLTWTQTAASEKYSKKLYQEEAKLPAYVDCKAWEGIRYKGGVKKGRLLFSHKVSNKHNNDADGMLGVTYSSDNANDFKIHPNKGNGNPNSFGHDVTTLPVGDNAYAAGYEREIAGYSTLTVPQQAKFDEGLKERAHLDGVNLRSAPDVTGWPDALAKLYKAEYDAGRLRRSYSEGLFDFDHTLSGSGDAADKEEFGKGRYQRGVGIGMALENLPDKTNNDDPLLFGYREGLHTRGEKDATERKKEASNLKEYKVGYTAGIRAVGYEHGHTRQAIVAKDHEEYMKAYMEGQFDCGREEGIQLLPCDKSQTDAYFGGWKQGVDDRGFEDGYGNKADASVNLPGYKVAVERGAHKVSYDEGYFDTEPSYDFDLSGPLKDSYVSGQFDHGYEQGYGVKGRDMTRMSNDYHKGYTRGLEQFGHDQGFSLSNKPNVPHPDNITVEAAFWNGVKERGREDALADKLHANNNDIYMQGYKAGSDELVVRKNAPKDVEMKDTK